MENSTIEIRQKQFLNKYITIRNSWIRNDMHLAINMANEIQAIQKVDLSISFGVYK